MKDESRLAEYEAVTTRAAFFDFSSRTLLEIRGEDRAAFLHNLCTNDIRRLQPGTGCEAFLLDARGHVRAHLSIFCLADRLLLETVPDQAQALLAHLEKYHIRERVELAQVVQPAWLVAGPNAANVLAGVIEGKLPTSLFDNGQMTLGGQPVLVAQVNIAGLRDFWITTDERFGAAVERALESAGASRCGPATFETARIVAGTPLFGPDINDKNLPQEVARNDRVLSFQKGCYLGQETVARIDALGHVNRTLCRLQAEGPVAPPAGTEIVANGAAVGVVTSATVVPGTCDVRLLSYLRRGIDQTEIELRVAGLTASLVA